MTEYSSNLPALAPTLMMHVASPVALHRAWRKVRANHGAAGVDAVSVREFERNLGTNLTELGRTLTSGSYQPLPPRIVNVSKSSGALRQLAIPSVRDRIAQRAVLDAIEPLFEPYFDDCSYAFRPGRSVEMAVQAIAVARANGFQWTLESDVEDFFPSIDHQTLLRDLGVCVKDPSILRLVGQWLVAGVLTESGSDCGIAFGGIQTAVASAGLAVSNATDELIEDWVAERLPSGGISTGGDFSTYGDDPASREQDAICGNTRRRSALRRLVESGLLLTLVERAVLRRLLTPAWLGAAGAGLAAVALAPVAVRKIRTFAHSRRGAAQGSPISPLLSNIYLHPFDVAISASGSRGTATTL